VQKLVAKLRRLWPLKRSAVQSRAPYEVTCACGQVATGFRQREYQTLRCSRCGNEVFVLPLSPFPAVEAVDDRPRSAPATAARSASRLWGLPVAAVALTLTALILIFYFLLPRPGNHSETAKEPIGPHLAAAQRYLDEGNFRQAIHELEVALQAEQASPSLNPAQRQRVTQLHREALVLADLLSESLEEIVRHAAGTAEAEWQREFAQRYQGKSVILDAEVSVNGAGEYEAVYDFFRVNGKEVRLDFSGLKRIPGLAEHLPSRLIFAMRLAGVDREPNAWVLRFHPDSAVLLTEAAAVAICCPALREDAHDIFTRQAEWMKK
jgi:hypothetical protein